MKPAIIDVVALEGSLPMSVSEKIFLILFYLLVFAGMAALFVIGIAPETFGLSGL